MSIPPPFAPLPGAAPPCPNCGQPWPPNAPACPNCGFLRPAGSSWPPAPSGQPGAAPLPPSGLVTRSATGDILLALGISVIAFASCGTGLLLNPILYFALRRQYPVFARGLGFGWIAGTALVLGALAVCFSSLSQSSQNVGG